MMNKKPVYINSLEASDIYSHMFRDRDIKDKFVGMIPFSLELIKLRSMGLKSKVNKINDKLTSVDVVNVKFNKKVWSAEGIKSRIKDEEKLKNFISRLQQDLNDIIFDKVKKWDELKNDDLRDYLYKNGFTITTTNPKTGKATSVKYVVYKRSSAKSRTGQCLFIRESLYQPMINWSRMDLPFVEGMEVDFTGLLSYESLVGSSLEDLIEIDPKNILIVDDVESQFNFPCNVIKKDANGNLDSFEQDYEIKNSLFDGQSLLDKKYFKHNQGMILLRQHFFKSAAFNCNIQQFLRDNCPDGVKFEEWQLTNMFGQKVYAKDVHMITTPTSLKLLKFDEDLRMSKEELWEHWKQAVEADDCVFGICKQEHQSKRGRDEQGNILQQLSYQMINSMPLGEDALKELTKLEVEYITQLKNNDDVFLDYLVNNANEVNSNLMLAEIAKRNKDFINTAIFRDFRKREINKYVTNCKRGKVRTVGDYCVMLGNPMEYLRHAIGEFDINNVDLDKLPLKGSEIYTKLFEDGLELVCFRNPHTSPSNVLVARNKNSKEIDKYFNLTKNIVCVNSINFPFQDILNGCDFDSDTLLIVKPDKYLLDAAKECRDNYKVCVNNLDASKIPYRLTKQDMAIIDNQLAQSQKNIGRVTNLGQVCLSRYWDLKDSGSDVKLDNLMRHVDVLGVLSGVCIDMSKKLYDINVDRIIDKIKRSGDLLTHRPTFFKYLSKTKKKNKSKVKSKNHIDYNCPMDLLNQLLTGLPDAQTRKNIDLTELLIKQPLSKSDRKQKNDILDYVKEMCNKLDGINATHSDDDDERNNSIDDVIKFYTFTIEKRNIKPDTMYSILLDVIKNNDTRILTRLLNVLFLTQRDVLLNSFKTKNDNCQEIA